MWTAGEVVEPRGADRRLVVHLRLQTAGPGQRPGAVAVVEEGVQTAGRGGIAAHAIEQAAYVVRHHPGVLGGAALGAAAAAGRAEGGPGAVFVAVLDVAAVARVEDVLPVLGAG